MRCVLIGAGGHARVVLDAARVQGGLEVTAVVDARKELRGQLLEGVPIVGTEDELEGLRRAGVEAALLGVGSVDVSDIRQRLFDRIASFGFRLPVIRHPAATVAASATLGPGSVVLAGAILNPGARLGANVIVNTGAIVDHDAEIGDHVHVSPGAHIAGDVRIGSGSHVGIGSTVIQGIRIGSRVLIAAGAVVVRDVPDGTRLAGVPGRPLGTSGPSAVRGHVGSGTKSPAERPLGDRPLRGGTR